MGFVIFYDELGCFKNGKDVISLDLLDKEQNSRYDVLCWLSKEALEFQLRTLGKIQPHKTCSNKLLSHATFFGFCDSHKCMIGEVE